MNICVPFSSKDVVIGRHPIVRLGTIVVSVDVQALVDLGLQNFYRWLLYGKVGHLDVEAVEFDSIDALTHVVCKSWLTGQCNTFMIWDGTLLMEVSE
jgi:hypothetical protein